MDVRINFGRHAGEIRDIAPEAALAMLKDGRASRPGEELPAQSADVPAGEVKPHPVGETAASLTIPPESAATPRRRSRR